MANKNLIIKFWGVVIISLLFFSSNAFAQLEITKLVDKTDVLSGELFTYTLQYRCASITDSCHNVVLTDVLPAGVRYHSLTGSVHTIGQTGAYNSGTHTVTFTFINPMPPGSTGDLTINCYFPNGITPEGTTATNTATITDGITPVTSNPVTVTSHASGDMFCSLLSATQQGSVGYESQYTIKVPAADGNYNAPLGILIPQDVTVVMNLMPGTTFVSAGNMERTANTGLPFVPENAITGTYDAGTNTITWTIPNSYIGLSTGSIYSGSDIPIVLTANVIYDNPPFTAGQNVSVDAMITYTPLGTSTPITVSGDPNSSDQCTRNLYRGTTLSAPNAQSTLYKEVSGSPSSMYSGETDSYLVTWENNGTVPLDNYVVEDLIPNYVKLKTVGMASHGGVTSTQTYRIFYKSELNTTYTELSTSPLLANVSNNINVYAADGGVNNVGLAANDRLTGIRIEYGTVQPGFYLNNTYWYFDLLDVPAEQTNTNCVTYTTTTTPVNGSQSTCYSFQHLPRPNYAQPYPTKQYTISGESFSSAYSVLPIGGSFWARMQVYSYASQPIINPVIMDLLPVGVVYDGEWTMPSQYNDLSLPMPTFEQIPNYNNSGRELLRWTWAASPTALDAQTQIFVKLKATNLVTPGVDIMNNYALSGDNIQGCYDPNTYEPSNGSIQDTYDIDGDGNTTEYLCFGSTVASNSSVRVNASAALESEKLVKGQCDLTYSKFPNFGQTMPGGIADYRLKVQNVGNIPMKDVIVIDILPWIGDVGVLDPQTRLTQWRPNLAGPVTPPTGVTVYYSTESNPCRTELNYSPAGCDAPNWSLTPPTDITTVQSLKFDFGSIVVAPGDSLILAWPMRAPVDAPTNDEIAWNSFGYVGTRTDNNSQLLASEPLKVGIKLKPLIPAVYGDYVWLDTNQNGLQDDGQTGVSGVRVDLYKDNGDGLSNPSTDLWIGFTVTDATGQYVFPALAPGDYFAVFSPPTGYTISPSNAGADDALDSDGIVTPVTHLDAGEEDYTWDLGIYLSPNCDVNITSYTISPCQWTGTASEVTVNVFIAWANAPAGENITVTLNGNTQTINVSGGATSPALVSFTMPANNTDYTLSAAFNTTGSCSDSQVIHMPLPCQPNVCVLNIDAVNVGACDLATGTATLDVCVSWSGAPAGENILVTANGETKTINVTGGVLPPAMLAFTIPADGSTNNPITTEFATTTTCSDNATYNAPTCAAPCSVSISTAAPTACDPANNTYNLDVTVIYTNPPTGDITINVGGTNYTFTPDGTSPDTYTVTGLASDGTTGVSVSATFAATPSCTANTTFDAPASCACALAATANNSQTNVSCNGGSDGSTTAIASGNTGAVTYLWSNGETTATINGLTAGDYTVTITETPTCTATASVTITEPTALSPTCDKTDVTTNGGSDGTASVSATGGTSPYTYAWSSGETASNISGKTSGTYTVTVTDNNGCTASCGSQINEPGVLCNLSGAGLGTPTCNNNSTTSDASDDYISFTLDPTGTTLGGSYTVSVSGGSITPNTGNYGSPTTFQLQNGSAGSGNTITVTITDNADTNCKVQVDIPDTGSCSNPACPPVKCLPVSITKQ